MIHKILSKNAIGSSGLALISLLIAACGGGQDDGMVGRAGGSDGGADAVYVTDIESSQSSAKSGPANKVDEALLSQGAKLSVAELNAAENTAATTDSSLSFARLAEGAIATKSAYASGQVAAKAAAVRIPAFRFYNGSSGAHFYTTNAAERDNVQSNLSPPFSYEGAAFSVASAFSPGLSAVHRFYNTQSGVHFYTISETERAFVAANLPQFSYEGVGYYASQVSGAGLTPLYRFYVPSRGFHFYTANQTERDNIQANLGSVYTYEGVGYHVLETNWRAEKLPHTGVTDQQCYEAGSTVLVPCAFPSATALNPQQDGHRSSINPLSYSQISNPNGGNFPITSCVQDNVTGLIWEGKEPAGARAGGDGYTNLGNLASGDASGYVNLVNQLSLCGYADWRLPTRMELLTLVDLGALGSTGLPPLKNAWLPNTALNFYWSSEVLNNVDAEAWMVSFIAGSAGRSDPQARAVAYPLRLVRGAVAVGDRFTFSSAAYGSDAANNVVNDAWTGLQWRRCEEGRSWNGSNCVGTANMYEHQGALAHAAMQTGWRLPNLKELSSLVELSVVNSSVTALNGTAFPGAQPDPFWVSTPLVTGPGSAWYVSFNNGYHGGEFVDIPLPIRLLVNN